MAFSGFSRRRIGPTRKIRRRRASSRRTSITKHSPNLFKLYLTSRFGRRPGTSRPIAVRVSKDAAYRLSTAHFGRYRLY